MQNICNLSTGEAQYFYHTDCKIYYWKAGTGAPIIFLHNAGTSHTIWHNQIAALAKSYTCYAVDLPGYGNSTSNPSNVVYSLDFYTNFLQQFIDQENLSQVTLVGNCLGSAIILNYARQDPEKVKNTILFHVLTKNIITTGPLRQLFSFGAALKYQHKLLKKVLGKIDLPSTFGKYLLNMQFGNKVTENAANEMLVKQITSKASQVPMFDILLDLDAYQALDTIEINEYFPTSLILWGSHNKVLSLQSGQKFCKEKNITNFKEIPGGGHLVMYEMPEIVTPMLQEFLIK